MDVNVRLLCLFVFLNLELPSGELALDVTMIIPRPVVNVQYSSELKCVADEKYNVTIGIETNLGLGDQLPDDREDGGIAPENWPGRQTRILRSSGPGRFGSFNCVAVDNDTGRSSKSIGGVIPSSAQTFPTSLNYRAEIDGPVDMKVVQAREGPTNKVTWIHMPAGGRPRRLVTGQLEVHIDKTTRDLAGTYSIFIPTKDMNLQTLLYRQSTTRIIIRRCDERSYGPQCERLCQECKNGGVCDVEDGSCICSPGFGGPTCQTLCGYNKFGGECQYDCEPNEDRKDGCGGKQFCLPDPYGCTCATGFSGLVCNRQCPSGKYGANCDLDCHCYSGECDPFTGECEEVDSTKCAPGWMGPNCQDTCPLNKHGPDCREECGNCFTDLPCNSTTGECPGAEASEEEGSGIPDDETRSNGTVTYFCMIGYSPPSCDQQCNNGTWGQDCLQECHCTENAGCDLTIGQCPLVSGQATGNGCTSGWQGLSCDQPCDIGTYGADCVQECGNCVNSSACHHISGECDKPGERGEVCEDGFEAPNCTEHCQSGKFGVNCSNDCNCANGTTCHPVDGRCNGYCAAGFTGIGCRKPCPAGTYGLNCTLECGNCLASDGKVVCDGERGTCPHGCLRGWEGGQCDHGTLCAQNPCKNNGTCEQTASIYRCHCPQGYVGGHCEVEQPACHMLPCKNRGLCTEGPDRDSYRCQCASPYTGVNCDVSLEDLFHGKNGETTEDLTPIILGAIIAGVAVLVLSGFLIWKSCVEKSANQVGVSSLSLVGMEESAISYNAPENETNKRPTAEDNESGVLECDGSSGRPSPNLQRTKVPPRLHRSSRIELDASTAQDIPNEDAAVPNHMSVARSPKIAVASADMTPDQPLQRVTVTAANKRISVNRPSVSGSTSSKNKSSSSSSSEASQPLQDLSTRLARMSTNSVFDFFGQPAEPRPTKNDCILMQFSTEPQSLASKRKKAQLSRRQSEMSVGGCAIPDGEPRLEEREENVMMQRRGGHAVDSRNPSRMPPKNSQIHDIPAGMTKHESDSLIRDTWTAEEEFEMETRRGSKRELFPAETTPAVMSTGRPEEDASQPRGRHARKNSQRPSVCGRNSLTRISEETSSVRSPAPSRLSRKRQSHSEKLKRRSVDAGSSTGNSPNAPRKAFSSNGVEDVNSVLKAIEEHANIITNQQEAPRRRSSSRRPSRNSR